MIRRLRVRAIPRRKRSGKMTGAIYLHKYQFSGKSVVVMDIDHYNAIRLQIIWAHKKLDQIKRVAGSLKNKPERIRTG